MTSLGLPPYRRWYRYGARSPGILAARLRNKWRAETDSSLLALDALYQRVLGNEPPKFAGGRFNRPDRTFKGEGKP